MKVFKVLGKKNVTKLLKKQSKKVKSGISNGMKQASVLLEKEAKASIEGSRAEIRSVDTGALRDSVQSRVDNKSATILSNKDYAKFIEYGTSKFTGRKHFSNTLARNKQAVINLVDKEIKI